MAKNNFIKALFVGFMVSALTACTSIGSFKTVGNTDPENTNVPSQSAPEVYHRGQGNITIGNTTLTGQVNDDTVVLNIDYEASGFKIFAQSKVGTYYHNGYSFSGDAVSGAAWTYYHQKDANFDSQFMIKGTLAPNTPIGLVSYKGNYFAAFPVRNNEQGYVLTPIIIEMNMDTGAVTGFDKFNLDIINIDASVDGNLITGTIYGPNGTIEFEVALFGNNGEEMGAGFQNGEIVGFIYVEFDEERTDLIN